MEKQAEIQVWNTKISLKRLVLILWEPYDFP